eukprot:m.296 g.296  ORF g.296 m.296 type:complete len:66 (+) comp1464_c0_seq1:420-617(+)
MHFHFGAVKDSMLTCQQPGVCSLTFKQIWIINIWIITVQINTKSTAYLEKVKIITLLMFKVIFNV